VLFRSENTVVKSFGVKPELLADYLTLVGDSGDHVPGVYGIGPATASELLNQNGPIYDWFNNIQDISATPLVKQKLINGREQMCISKSLISLKNTNVPLISTIFSSVDLFGDGSIQESPASPQVFFDRYEITHPKPYEFLFLEED
jgi:5'-3' exonuclease